MNNKPRDLARLLASYARDGLSRVEAAGDAPSLNAVRTALEEALGVRFEGERGAAFFRSTVVQTLFYGVFSAWVLWARQTPPPAGRFNWHESVWHLRAPVLQALFQQLSSPGRLNPLGLVEVLDWTSDALDRVDRDAFFARFNEGEAVPYFYEPFLESFDPALRKQLGVWYTPRRGGALHVRPRRPGPQGRPRHRRRVGGRERLRPRSLLRHRRLPGRDPQAHRLQPRGQGPVRTVQEGVRIFYTNEGTVWGFAHPFVNETYQCLKTSADLAERDECAREIGNFLYDNYADIPMFHLKADVTVNPEYITDYVWPGLTSVGVSHFHAIKGVRE